MPIVITRAGEALHLPVLTQQQKDAAWEAVIRAFAMANPDKLKELEEPA